MPSIVANNDESKLTEFDFRRYVDFHLLRLSPSHFDPFMHFFAILKIVISVGKNLAMMMTGPA